MSEIDRNPNNLIEAGKLFNIIKLVKQLKNNNTFKDNFEIHNEILNLDAFSFKNVYKKLGKDSKYLLDKYSDKINNTYKDFIKLCDAEKLKDFVDVEFFEIGDQSEIQGNFSYDSNDDKMIIKINIEKPYKGEIFTQAMIAALCSNFYNRGSEIILLRGFSEKAYNSGKCTDQKNVLLARAVEYMLVEEIILSLTKEKPKYIYSFNEKGQNANELIDIAKRVRNITNTIQSRNKVYIDIPNNDILLYDYFVNRNTEYTQNIIDGFYGAGVFKLLSEEIEKLALYEGKKFMDEYYKIIEKLDTMNKI